MQILGQLNIKGIIDNIQSQSKAQILKHLLTYSLLVDKDISNEMERAVLKFGGFNSYHEGYGILLEELDKLWEEIKSKESNPEALYKEAIQVTAIAREIALYAVQHIQFKC